MTNLIDSFLLVSIQPPVLIHGVRFQEVTAGLGERCSTAFPDKTWGGTIHLVARVQEVVISNMIIVSCCELGLGGMRFGPHLQ